MPEILLPRPAAASAGESSRRERILGAALALLTLRGYAGTSTLEIASRARVSKRELYVLFESKHAILIACIDRRTALLRLPISLPDPHDRPALLATLTAFGQVVLRELSSPAVVALYRLAAVEADRLPEVGRALETVGRTATLQALTEFLARAQASGVLGAGGEPVVMAGQFFGLLWGDLLLRRVLGVADPPTSQEVDRRSRAASAALLTLHPAQGALDR